MKKVPVNGRFKIRDYALVDDQDYGRVIQYSWHDTGAGYIATSGPNNQNILLHRLILFGIDDIKNGKKVDHINHDTYDNTRANLRACTQSENQQNTWKPTLPEGYYTEQEAAQVLGYKSIHPLYALYKKNIITRYKLINTPCYLKKEIDELIQPPEGYISFKEACDIFMRHNLKPYHLHTYPKRFHTKRKFRTIYFLKSDIEKYIIPRKMSI